MSWPRLFRVTRREFAGDTATLLSGLGGFYAGGRWHAKGSRVTYFGSNISLCVLEHLAHLDVHPTQNNWPLVVAEVSIQPDFLKPENVRELSRQELEALDPNWRMPDSPFCLRIGVR